MVETKAATVGRSRISRLVSVPLVAVFALATMAATAQPVAAATGQGTAYQSSATCDPYRNTMELRGFAAAAPGLNVQDIQVRWQIQKLVNGVWVVQAMDTYYSATGWLQFRHYRYWTDPWTGNVAYSAHGSSQPLTITMNGSANGTYRVFSQYRWFYNYAWTAPTGWIHTASYTNLPYLSYTYPTCAL